MIIQQNIAIKDRKSLDLVKSYMENRRDKKRAMIVHQYHMLTEEWTAERLAQRFLGEISPPHVH